MPCCMISRNTDVITSDIASVQQNLLWNFVGQLLDKVKDHQTDNLNQLKAATFQRVSDHQFHQILPQCFLLQL